MIRHTVAFSLRHSKGSAEELKFLNDALVLADIPGVMNFEQLRQTSSKNDFDFGFSMEFEDQVAYDAYSRHPIHVAFVRERWEKEVEDFLELDYEKI
jgi:hypothetical protein